jgi:transketolase
MTEVRTSGSSDTLRSRAVNAIRALVIDATQAAGDGHPGMPMGTAPLGYVLYRHVMKHNPKNPSWADRDRYVQSAGHGSMLQYSLLHLTGYDLPMEELERYRQWGSRTPGHPEVGHTPGVETTTGPLGQGISTAVGMALAEAHLAARFNRPGFEVIDHHTYVIASDGDIMEGISSEASSFAGHHQLGKLIVLYDDNGISIDGHTDITFTEDVQARYRAYGWHVQAVDDANDIDAVQAALDAARAETDRPSFIAIKSIIGYGAPHKQGTSAVHGSVLGDEEAKAAKANLGIDWPPFTVPDDVLKHYREVITEGERAERTWNELMAGYRQAHPDLARELERTLTGTLPDGFDADLPHYDTGTQLATRKASQQALNAIAPHVPELIGGSADLAGSNHTDIDGAESIAPGHYGGRILHFGIREHAMAAIGNGLALHGGIRPFVATFLIFSDYLRPALRLGALMRQHVLYVFTHDSIGLGGDGPTHQPIAQIMALRAIPNVTVLRPADPNETAQAWAEAMRHQGGPVAFALTRQNLPALDVPEGSVARGGYVLAKEDNDTGPDVLLIATGSEVSLCLEARTTLEQEGVHTRVISLPSWELFQSQDPEYRDSVLPPDVKARVTVEAGATLGWERYAGDHGVILGVDRFGESAPGERVMKEYGFTPEHVAQAARQSLAKVRGD